ncbi:PBP1A family penicillin-binding protein [Alkalimonas collagenimarina]|uniref:Penicillin-binding protein 1A n=1 Tax=Alkalimonas collagenimarina TaxID=400390 RepID=A0ABT9H1X2_9GAMM|nr:PBP1A family penicillin-binding protein [Alkalimonas collagenimarina]MDP4537283.1 PBP1A family penicillin-binding protein [Alkalimonas collagenimarina]
MFWLKKIVILCLIGLMLAVAAVLLAYWYVKDDLPDVSSLQDVRLQTPMRVFTADGELMSQFGEQRRIPLTLDEMPPQLIQAFLATEDSRFYDHPGFDVIGMMRAAIVVASTRDAKQGASTITQQLARNFFLTREKKVIRKIKEIFLAIRIEQLLSKDEILELYLNKIELGHRAFGVGAAAQVYFGKTIDELTLDEIAIIAGLPQAPSILNPVRSPSNARNRRNIVLGRMLSMNYIDQTQYQQALQAPITSRRHGAQITASAPYIAEMVRQEMVERFGEEYAYNAGLQVYTTINKSTQDSARKALQKNLYDYDERHGYRGPEAVLWQQQDNPSEEQDADTPWDEDRILSYLAEQSSIEDLHHAVVLAVEAQQAQVVRADGQQLTLDWDGLKWARAFITDHRQSHAPKQAADILQPGMHVQIRHNGDDWQLSQMPEATSALVAMDPRTGAIQALVGGFSFAQSQFNRATQAKRQVGSNIKPFIYSAALEHDYTLASVINDAPIHHWDQGAGIAWRPRNSPAVYDGPIRVREALAKSKNVVSVRLMRGVGIDDSIQHLKRFGFAETDLPRNETLSLGSASLTPVELMTGYAVFANGGFLVKPYVIEKVYNEENELIYQHQAVIACSDCGFDTPVETTEVLDTEAQLAQLFAEPQLDEAAPAATSPKQAPRVISEQNAFLITEALKSSIWGGGHWNRGTGWNGTGWRVQSLERRDISGKTGTTNDSKDTWFTGYNRQIVTTSWVGFDDSNRSLGRATWNANFDRNQSSGVEAGARTALPAWLEFMRFAMQDMPVDQAETPAGISSVRIDLETGLLSRANDHTSRFEFFVRGTEPTQYVQPGTPGFSFDDDEPATELLEIFD